LFSTNEKGKLYLIEAKEFVDGAMGLFAKGFGLCPLVLDGIDTIFL